MEDALALPDEAEKVNEKAQPEFEELDVFQKPKAIMNAAKNIQKLGKLPSLIQKTLDSMKEELESTQKTIEDMKESWDKLEGQGKQCAAAQVMDPVRCYQQIYGVIAHTPEEKKQTLSRMEGKCKKRHLPFKNPYE